MMKRRRKHGRQQKSSGELNIMPFMNLMVILLPFLLITAVSNSIRQDDDSRTIAGLERISQSDIAKEQEYQALNVAKGLGRIHVIPKLDDHVEIGFNEILVLDEVPLQLPPVAGVITSHPSTPLSHINLLAKGWGIPNAYVKNALTLLKQYDGWWVPGEGHARPRIDAELDHLVAVIQQEAAEIGRLFPLEFRPHREIECDD